MANDENLRPVRTKSEARERGRNGGKASGEARRRKADFRKTLNMLLTVKIDHPEWTPMLEAMGLDSTLESAVNAAMIREALAGNVKAYEAIRNTIGQTLKSELDIEEQMAKIVHLKAQAESLKPEKENDQLVKYTGIPANVIAPIYAPVVFDIQEHRHTEYIFPRRPWFYKIFVCFAAGHRSADGK